MDSLPKTINDQKAIQKVVDELISKMDLDEMLVLNICLSMALAIKVKRKNG